MSTPKPTKKVTLEGRTRLPLRVQDLVIDLGLAMTSIQQTSGSTDMLITSIRNLTSVDGIMANSEQNLDKIQKQMDRMEAQAKSTEQNLQNVTTVVNFFDTLEQNSYCAANVKNSSSSSKTWTKNDGVEKRAEKEVTAADKK